MPSPPHIDLVAKLNRARERPDYDVFAAEQQVGRIYLMHESSEDQSWWWGVNGVTFDSTVRVEMKGATLEVWNRPARSSGLVRQWLDWASRCRPGT